MNCEVCVEEVLEVCRERRQTSWRARVSRLKSSVGFQAAQKNLPKLNVMNLFIF